MGEDEARTRASEREATRRGRASGRLGASKQEGRARAGDDSGKFRVRKNIVSGSGGPCFTVLQVLVFLVFFLADKSTE